ncbi:MetQ/NlpA family ABC transporter substrate-binding protein [Haloglycomyces albus]|uniref:MetQ/NlpA family ABC transporter substrate-binding protein n=1 Tax=Haloglycomyces albus TaxID=526067 RepID=UPI00046D957A|nr:MetQ/NlpA family ABC transporter substrate-binding protein [Haloglycomyces albus]
MKRQLITTATVLPVAALGLSACGQDGEGSGDALTVAATTVPHAEILEYVSDELAADADLELDIVTYNDYVQPNVVTSEGEVDANFFQHQPYLDHYNSENDTELVTVAPVHIEPLGLYSEGAGNLDELSDGSEIAIPNDTTNGGRALQLLADSGLIELEEGIDATSATVDTITSNPHDFTFTELEAAQLPRSLDSVEGAVINGNYALEADLNPEDDALASETVEDNPFANFVVTTPENEDDKQVQKLVELLQSDEVADFLAEEYDGSVLAAF